MSAVLAIVDQVLTAMSHQDFVVLLRGLQKSSSSCELLKFLSNIIHNLRFKSDSDLPFVILPTNETVALNLGKLYAGYTEVHDDTSYTAFQNQFQQELGDNQIRYQTQEDCVVLELTAWQTILGLTRGEVSRKPAAKLPNFWSPEQCNLLEIQFISYLAARPVGESPGQILKNFLDSRDIPIWPLTVSQMSSACFQSALPKLGQEQRIRFYSEAGLPCIHYPYPERVDLLPVGLLRTLTATIKYLQKNR